MSDSAPPTAPPSEPNSQPNSVRLRKERREAKIRAGGSARLNRITGLGGGVQRDPPQPPPAPTSHADPDEVDISQHFYEPQTTRRTPLDNASFIPPTGPSMSDDQLRQMMLGFDPTATPPPGANPFAGFPGMGGAPGMEMPGADDPMMKMLQQMMGSMGDGPGGGAPAFPGMPPMPGQTPPAPAQQSSAYVWRILHALFALGLGLYIALTTPSFTGTKYARDLSSLSPTAIANGELSPTSIHFFYLFATFEVILQTSRFFMEKGKPQHTGILGTVMNFIPEPYRGYLGLGSRYFRIWTTVSGDAMVCVFVLGATVWLRGNQ